ncbi:MAG: FtsX-like permease family protein [candidate division Zixibacteria bacterium]|nr:FtsX-like permease family protein [candidate division Zixibacteria bacterium]MDH3936847.1 FtsX-like permease family protein [candidate division Zixibacteria bacterium]MDH4033140.1 FtsX-like permease family protein [candidate division Zixibacteria bacterium]
MLIFKIAFRNCLRQKRRTTLTVLTMLGGFVLASVSIAWSDGSYDYVINMFTRHEMGHIQIHRQGYLDRPTLYQTIDDYESLGAAFEQAENVQFWTPRLFSSGLASVAGKSSGVKIIGVDPVRENSATSFDRKVTKGKSLAKVPSHQALLSEALAQTLKAGIGDEVVIVSQAADGSIANDLYQIVGLTESGDAITDRTSLYLHIEDAQELLVLENRAHEIAVVVEDLDGLDEVAVVIAESIDRPELDVATWQVFAKSFYTAMQADQKGTWISLFVIILVVSVGVLNTVLMTVLERTREYGVLRAVGTAGGQVVQMVIYEVLVMAVVSVIIGSGIAYGVNYFLSIEGIPLPTPLTFGGIVFDRMFTIVNVRSFVIPAVTVFLSAMVTSIFPAGMAARTAPAKAMRSE